MRRAYWKKSFHIRPILSNELVKKCRGDVWIVATMIYCMVRQSTSVSFFLSEDRTFYVYLCWFRLFNFEKLKSMKSLSTNIFYSDWLSNVLAFGKSSSNGAKCVCDRKPNERKKAARFFSWMCDSIGKVEYHIHMFLFNLSNVSNKIGFNIIF